MQLIHIVENSVIFFLGIRFFGILLRYLNLNLRILKHGCLRICSMSLNGNRVDKVCFLSGIKDLFNLFGQDSVFGPAKGSHFNMLHVFDRGEGVEAKLREHNMPIVKGCVIVMNRVRGVSERLQNIADALRSRLLQYRLVRILARSEEVQIHSGNRLELRIGRSGSYRGDIQIAGCIMLLQILIEGHRILGIFNVFNQLRVEKGLKLKENDIHGVIRELCRRIFG